MEQIKLMLEKMGNDETFGKKMQSIISKGDTAAIINAAEEGDFSITEAIWQKFLTTSAELSKQSVEKLSESELEKVSGGSDADVMGVTRSKDCFFYGSGNPEMRDGAMRKYCRQFACVMLFSLPGERNLKWWRCRCWGTDKCVDNWHYEAGCRNGSLG